MAAALLVVSLAGCSLAGPADRSAGSAAGADATWKPARLAANPPEACLRSIEAIASAGSGSKVMLGPAAFSASDELVLIQPPRRGPDGTVLDGRMRPAPPVVYKLASSGGRCAIRRAGSSGSGPQAGAGASSAPVPGSTSGSMPSAGTPATADSAPMALPDCRCETL